MLAELRRVAVHFHRSTPEPHRISHHLDGAEAGMIDLGDISIRQSLLVGCKINGSQNRRIGEPPALFVEDAHPLGPRLRPEHVLDHRHKLTEILPPLRGIGKFVVLLEVLYAQGIAEIVPVSVGLRLGEKQPFPVGALEVVRQGVLRDRLEGLGI